MPATPELPQEKQALLARAGEEKRLTDKRVNLLLQVALHEYFTDLHIAKGKAAAGSGSSEHIGFLLAQRHLPPKSDKHPLAALRSQTAPISASQSSAGGAAGPAKAR